jgi:hypothetical protein
MLEEQFPIESQVGLYGVIASNSVKLAKANLGGITITAMGLKYRLDDMVKCVCYMDIGCNGYSWLTQP